MLAAGVEIVLGGGLSGESCSSTPKAVVEDRLGWLDLEVGSGAWWKDWSVGMNEVNPEGRSKVRRLHPHESGEHSFQSTG